MVPEDKQSNAKEPSELVDGDYSSRQAKIEMGAVGTVFGNRIGAPANVAALISVAAAGSLIFAVFAWSGSENFTYKDGISLLSSLLTLTIGYLFGRVKGD